MWSKIMKALLFFCVLCLSIARPYDEARSVVASSSARKGSSVIHNWLHNIGDDLSRPDIWTSFHRLFVHRTSTDTDYEVERRIAGLRPVSVSLPSPTGVSPADGSDWFPDSEKQLILDPSKMDTDMKLWRLVAQSGGYEDEFPSASVFVPDGFSSWGSSQAFSGNDDCHPISSNALYVICDCANWAQVNRHQFPDVLEYLALNATAITRFGEDSFAGKAVLFLQINNHGNVSFDPGAFRNLRLLQVLHVTNNAKYLFSKEEEHSFFHPFRHLLLLTQLVIRNNGLSLVDVDSVKKSEESILPLMNYLSLKQNNLGRLEEFFFYPIRNSPVHDLNLHSAGLKSIHENAFKYLPQLKHVDFFNNPLLTQSGLSYAFPQALKPLSSQLHSLGLGAGDLYRLPYRAANAVANITRINLSSNRLKTPGSYEGYSTTSRQALPNMTYLTEFLMPDNGANDVYEFTFATLPNLSMLDVSKNNISSFFKGLQVESLTVLDLSNQCTDRVLFDRCKSEEFQLHEGDFENMGRLTYLNLGTVLIMNQIIREDTFNGLLGLEDLFLDNTGLKYVADFALAHIPNLRRLDLSNNNELFGFNSHTFAGLSHLEKLNMSMSSMAFTTPDPELELEDPKAMDSNMTMRYLNKQEVADILLNLTSLRELFLSCSLDYNCVGSVSHDELMDAEVFSSLVNLEVLDLSKNSLNAWNEDIFIGNTKLQYLSLASNKLFHVTPGMLESFRRLKVLDMRDNFILCDDKVTEFHLLWEELRGDLFVVGYKGGDGYVCNLNENQDLNDVTTYRAFAEAAMRAALLRRLKIASLAVIAFTLLVASVLVYKKRYYLAYELVRRRRRLGVRRKRHLDGNFSHDVFVCYAEEERQWVMEELLPELERGIDGGKKIRACVHERDFKVGVTVTENIVNSIDGSRKFLLVLSRNVPASSWCRFEIDVAHKRFIEEEGKDFFLVVIREVPKKSAMDKSLKLLLSEWTYLKYKGDSERQRKEFFQKLKESISKHSNDGSDARLRNVPSF